MISACVVGTVGQDAELKFVNGTPVMKISVASKRWEKGANQTDWVSVNLWGKRAESLSDLCRKGTRVAARGSLCVREYPKKDGTRGFSIELRADDIEVMSDGRGAGKPHATATAHRAEREEMEDDGMF